MSSGQGTEKHHVARLWIIISSFAGEFNVCFIGNPSTYSAYVSKHAGSCIA